MTRLRLVILWLLCLLAAPILLFMMLMQALLGSARRAQSMAVAFDECGNSLFGGDPQESISRRVGLAVMAGKPWAKPIAPAIDYFFGPGHCAAEAK